MLAVSIVLGTLALVGHAALWVGVVNRWHATGFPRPLVKSVTLAFYAALLAIPPAVVAHLVNQGALSTQQPAWTMRLDWATAYIAFCAAYGAVHVPVWAFDRLRRRGLPPGVRLTSQRVVDVAKSLGGSPARGPRARVFSRLPFNQIWHLHVSQFEIQLPRLPPPLAGLSICHLSDLHLSGRIDRAYFEEVVRLTNALDVDLIVLTGDVCDKAPYIAWIADTLGPLQARIGKFFILGNHDLRTRAVGRVREAMREGGFVDVGGRHATIAGGSIVVAGDERPWFKDSPSLVGLPPDALRILLAHTPDQIGWARRERFDLMFAGHTHGGQLRFPLVGPVVCPSWHGTRYAAGFFHERPTLLHVSRGTAGLFPYRLNCPPEITKLVVRPAT
jgi:predicted MPP superfamily phosphohydrolase